MSIVTTKKIDELLETQRNVAAIMFGHIREVIKEDEELSMATIPILKVLYKHDTLSQHALAEKLHHSDAAISRQVAILEKKGHIQVVHDTANRRLSMLQLTDSGRTVVDRMRRKVEAYFATALAELSSEEIDVLLKANQKLCDVLCRTKKDNGENNE